jgi:hypothetical protein
MEKKYYDNDIVEIMDDNVIIKDTEDIFGIFSINNCSTIILKKENIVNNFYDLSTGIAGEILQKFSNYRKRMAIVGNFENMKNKSFKDFMYESNKTKQILFVKTSEEALKAFNE